MGGIGMACGLEFGPGVISKSRDSRNERNYSRLAHDFKSPMEYRVLWCWHAGLYALVCYSVVVSISCNLGRVGECCCIGRMMVVLLMAPCMFYVKGFFVSWGWWCLLVGIVIFVPVRCDCSLGFLFFGWWESNECFIEVSKTGCLCCWWGQRVSGGWDPVVLVMQEVSFCWFCGMLRIIQDWWDFGYTGLWWIWMVGVLCNSQNKIGWQHLLKGPFSNQWTQIQGQRILRTQKLTKRNNPATGGSN